MMHTGRTASWWFQHPAHKMTGLIFRPHPPRKLKTDHDLSQITEITGMAATEANNPMIIRAFIVLYIDMLINDSTYTPKRERERGEREGESAIYDRCENQIIYQLNYWQTLRCALVMKRSLSLALKRVAKICRDTQWKTAKWSIIALSSRLDLDLYSLPFSSLFSAVCCQFWQFVPFVCATG